MANFVVPTIYTAIDKFTAPVRKMAAASTNFARKAEVGVARAERGFRRLLSPIRAVTKAAGRLGLVLGATALIGIASSGIGVFKDYEQANASLSSVMNTTTENQRLLAVDSQRLGAVTAKTATEVVGLQEAFARLGFETPDILAMTQATINGSVAMQGELSATAELVGAMVKSFDAFGAVNAPEIIDQMTVSTQKSALNFEKLQTALPIVAGAANAAGISFTRTLALLGKLSDAGIDASSSATALRNIFIESKKRGFDYSQILQHIQKNQDKLTTATDIFGKRAAVSGSILANNLAGIEALDKQISATGVGQENFNASQKAADKQLDTLTGSLTILNSAYEGFILSLENGTGAFSSNLKMAARVGTELLTIASGATLSTFKLTDQAKAVRENTKVALYWLKLIRNTIGALVLFKVALVAAKVVLGAYRIGLAIALGLQGASSLALKGHTTALLVNAGAAKIAAAATWLFGAALSIGLWPLTLIVAAIGLLIGLIVVIVKKYHEWGAALTFVIAPLGFIINLIQSFRRNWDLITEAFKSGGIKAGLLAIGKTMLDAVLMPLQQLLELISKIPGSIGNIAGSAALKIETTREKLGVNTTTDESGVPLVTKDVTREEVRSERTENLEKQQLDININSPGGLADIVQRGKGIPILISSTQGFD